MNSPAQDLLVDLSHRVGGFPSSSSGAPVLADKPKNPVGRPRKIPTPPPSDDERGVKFSSSKKEKKMVEEIDEARKEKERIEAIRKVNQYLDSKVFKRVLQDLELKKMRGSESLDVANEALSRIKSVIGMAYKRIFVNKMFDLAGMTVGQIGEKLFKLQHFVDFPDQLSRDRMAYEEELEEIAIELNSDYVPSAKVRLGIKIMTAAFEFDKQAKLAGTAPPPQKPPRGEKEEEEEDEDEDELLADRGLGGKK